MSNSFYNHGAFPSTGSAATSASMRAELDLVAAGFDKMPTLSGNANKFIIVNSTGTALTQTDVLPAFTVTDTDFTVQDDGDNTRKFKFNAGSITTGNTRVYVMPDLDTTLVGTNVTQTLTNKTLTAPVIATIVNTGTLTLPTSTDTLVGRNTTDTLTNKTLTNPVIGTIVNTGTLTLPTATDTLVGRQTTDTLTNKTISGASNTLSNIANGSLSNSSIVIGSSTLSLGGTMTTLAGVTISGASNTLSNIANASLTNSSITINGSTVALGSSVTVTATATNALTIGNGLSGTSYNGSSAVTIAINTGVTADLSTAQTFSNKTISGSANTLSNIANASLTNSAITIGSTAISLGATSLTLAGLTSASATTLISTGNQATSVAISAIGHSSGTVTVTTSTAHGLTTGDVASIDGVADYTFCGVYTVTVSNANVFTYSQTASGASSSGGFSTKLSGTWGLYAGGTGPSLANGPVMINASSQLPALRVTQGGSGYALIVEDAANPDTSAFIISNAGDLAINTNKFTVAAASGNTVIGGTTSFGGNIVSNVLFTDATYDIGATGANRPRDLFLSRNLVVGGTLTLAGGVNLNGNVTIGDASSDTLTINSTITSNLIFTDNTYDIGASGATRPRNLYLAGTATIGGNTGITGALTATGDVISGTGSTQARLIANSSAASFSDVLYQTAGVARWAIEKTGAEGGSNAGGDLYFYRYSDAGGYLGNPLTITRSTGLVTANSSLAVTGTLSATSTITASSGASGSSIALVTIGTANNTVGGSGNQLLFNYGNNASSRSWKLVNDFNAFGDLSIAQSTTQTGSTYTSIATFNSTGVGIGNNNPQSKLHIQSAVNTSETLITLQTGWSSPSGNKSIAWTDGSGRLGAIGVNYTAPQGAMTFGSLYNSGYNTTDLMTLTPSGLFVVGNINIGTTANVYKLDVNTVGGSIATARLIGNDQSNVRLRLENSGGSGRTWELVAGLQAANNSDFSIYDVTAGTTSFVIKPSGNVGIGENSPSDKLVVVGSIGISGGRGTSYALKFADWTLYNTSSGGNFTFSNYTTELVTITQAGTLLVGTNSTSGSLTNYNPVYAGSFKTAQGSVSTTSGVAATLFTAPAGFGSYFITVWINADDCVNYQLVAVLSTQPNGSAKISTIVIANLITVSLSGYSVQATQASGGSATVNYTATRIAA